MQNSDLPQISSSLFWDTRMFSDSGKLETVLAWTRYYKFIIERVLERGDIDDFKELVRYYGHTMLKDVISSSRRISGRGRAFGIALYGINQKEVFQCFPMSSQEKLWPY